MAALCVLGHRAGIVVVDLVVVPGHDPGAGGVGGLEVGIGPVERVAVPVVGERRHLSGRGVPDDVAVPHLVDVVAQVDDQLRLLSRHMAVRGVVAVLVVLAGGEGEAEAPGNLSGGGRGPEPAGWAPAPARVEPVPVPPPRLEPLDLGVDGVSEFRESAALPGPDDLPEGVVGRHLPPNRDLPRGGVREGECSRVEPGPEHGAGGRGIAGGDTQRERTLLEAHAPNGPPGGEHAGGGQGGETATEPEEPAAREESFPSRDARKGQLCGWPSHGAILPGRLRRPPPTDRRACRSSRRSRRCSARCQTASRRDRLALSPPLRTASPGSRTPSGRRFR